MKQSLLLKRMVYENKMIIDRWKWVVKQIRQNLLDFAGECC